VKEKQCNNAIKCVWLNIEWQYMSFNKRETKHIFMTSEKWLESYESWLIKNYYVHHVATTSTSKYSVLFYYCDFLIKSRNQSSDLLIFHENYFQEWFKTYKTYESECQWFDEW